jgi:acyl-CoA synthetase (AMP-forming)/AMP-acid ligase II
VTHLAANRAGVTFVSVAPSASASDVGEVLRRANLRGLVLSEEFIEPMRKLVPELYSGTRASLPPPAPC